MIKGISTKKKISLDLSQYGQNLAFEMGNNAKFGTPAYWIYQWTNNPQKIEKTGRSLQQELVACMLGGFGITGELSSAYYKKINVTFENINTIDCSELEKLLRTPVTIDGKNIKYRYPRQKAKQISQSLNILSEKKWEKLSAPDLRENLLSLPGVGLKTASWVVRNYTGSDEVAIIDIHLHRAGLLAGFFKPEWVPSKNYKLMEAAFLKFSQEFNISAGGLDLLIWNHMRVRNFTPSHLLKLFPDLKVI